MIRLIEIGYLTASESAEYLGVSRVKFYEWGHKGLLPEPALAQKALTLWALKDIAKLKKLIGGEPYLGRREQNAKRKSGK